MKKNFKLNTSAFILASLVSGQDFEKSTNLIEGKNQVKNVLRFDESTIIGQVKSVDSEKSKIRVTYTDGSDCEYSVKNFAQIQSNGKSTQLGKIKKGAWVMMLPTKDDFQSVDKILVKSA